MRVCIADLLIFMNHIVRVIYPENYYHKDMADVAQAISRMSL
jgi:hypothetical protein